MSSEKFFGDAINWKGFQEGLQEIASEKKPGIIVISKTWCPTCKKVGSRFKDDSELTELSHKFVMVYCCDDDEPDFDEFRPDGSYYPRFFFVNKNGDINYSIASGAEGSLYRYFYSSTDAFKENMRKALELPANKE